MEIIFFPGVQPICPVQFRSSSGCLSLVPVQNESELRGRSGEYMNLPPTANPISNKTSCMAQRKRAGLITRRSLDRNELQLEFDSLFAFFCLDSSNRHVSHCRVPIFYSSFSAFAGILSEPIGRSLAQNQIRELACMQELAVRLFFCPFVPCTLHSLKSWHCQLSPPNSPRK